MNRKHLFTPKWFNLDHVTFDYESLVYDKFAKNHYFLHILFNNVMESRFH